MKRRYVVASLVALLAIGMVGANALAQGSVTMLGTWGGGELDAFQKVLDAFEEETGITVEFTGTRDLAAVLVTRLQAGNPPDLAAVPNPGQMQELAAEGVLVDLATVLDMEQFHEDYSEAWVDLGSADGTLHALFISADLKSLVWYNPKQFADHGYAVPSTWDEMIALSDQMVADGNTPWAIGLESGAASGWPATDWIEDIMLRTAGPDVYDEWVDYDISWDDPAVVRAFELFGQIARNPDYVHGGTTGVLATAFGDSPNALFTSPPRAFMHRQATFIQGFINDNNPDLVAGEDYDFFMFPSIDEQWGVPALGAADMISMFRSTPEADALMQYLAGPEAQSIWVSELGKLSPNARVSADAYTDDLTRKAAQLLVDADTFRFDGSDLMPAAVGAGAFLEGTLNYVAGDDLSDVLMMIEFAAEDAY